MNNDMNIIARLLTIIANSGGITIRELNSITNIPAEVIKRELEYISSNRELYFIDLYPDDNYDETSQSCMDIKWRIDGFPEDKRVLSLNPLEKYLYKAIIDHEMVSYDGFLGIYTKSTYNLENYNYKLCQISMAVSNKKRLSVKYKNMSGDIQNFIIEPLGIVFYEFDNILYVIGQYDDNIVTYRIDRILSIKETKEKFIPLPGFELSNYMENIWGMEQGEAISVRVKFIKTGSIAYKIKRDLECRKNKKLQEFDDCIIYKDSVVGINSFKRWLRTYGSAAIVIEPRSLREQMINSARQCLNYYLEEDR